MPTQMRFNAQGQPEYYDTETGALVTPAPNGFQNEYFDRLNKIEVTDRFQVKQPKEKEFSVRSSLGRMPETEAEVEALFMSGQIDAKTYNEMLNRIIRGDVKPGTFKTEEEKTPNNGFKMPAINFAGSDLSTELYSLGMNIGKAPGTKGRTAGIVGSAGAALLGGARDVLGGLAFQKASQRSKDYIAQQMAKQKYTADDQYLDNNTVGGFRYGGYFEDGGMSGNESNEQMAEGSEEPQIDIEKLLTGENIKGLSPNGGIEANAELEGDEYLQFPDGTTQRVVGKDHEEGGVKMAIPDGTKVISKTLKPNKKQFKDLESTYDLKLSKDDTYAEVVDKYANKIGLTKKYKEQEELFAALKDVFKDTKMSGGTRRVNQSFLEGKIAKVENEKVELEAQKQEFFNTVFDMQESTKPEKERGTEVFKMGGTSYAGFDSIAEKHNIPKGDLLGILRKAGATNLPKFDKGSKAYKANKGDNALPGDNIVKQSANERNYGDEKTNEDIILNLYKNFPDIITDDAVFGKYIDKEKLKKGEVVFTKNLPFNKENELTLNFQKKADARMKASANTIINNKDRFDPETVKMAIDYLANETFTGDAMKDMDTQAKVRSYDKKMGNFTSSRYNLGLDIVTPDEKVMLEEKGIYTLNQLSDEELANLSDQSKARVEEIRKIKGEDADFSITTYNPQGEPETPEDEVPKTGPKNPDPRAGLIDDVNLSGQKPYQSKMFYTPDQSSIPPSALEVGVALDNTFQRIDPIRIGIEQNLQEAADSRQFIADQLNGLPSAQRAASLASLLATSQDTINRSIVDTNRLNAENIASTEIYNAGRADAEGLQRSENLLNYDARAMQAKANTEEEIRNWMDRNQTVALNNFANQQRLNLMDAAIPDYDINFMGLGVDYNPAYDWKVRGPKPETAQTTTVSAEDLNKKGLEKIIQQYYKDPNSITFKASGGN